MRLAKKNRERGSRIRQLRLGKGWEQSDLGDAVGVHFSHVSKWEGGAGISNKHLMNLARVLETSVEFIETGTAIEPQEAPDSAEALNFMELIEKAHSLSEKLKSGNIQPESREEALHALEFVESLIRSAKESLRKRGPAGD